MVLAKLANYGIPNKLAFQIQDFYKEETLDIVENYPYQLVEDIKGLGFTIADQLAAELGIESQAPERFRAGLVHSLFQGCMDTGDTYMEARDLLEQTLTLLESSCPVELDPSQVAQELSHLIEEDKVQQIDTKIFDNSLFSLKKAFAVTWFVSSKKESRKSGFGNHSQAYLYCRARTGDSVRYHSKTGYLRRYPEQGLYPDRWAWYR